MKKIFLTLFIFLFISSCISFNNNFEGRYWKLVSIEGEKVPINEKILLSKKNIHLIFQSNGRVTGNTGCNIVNGKFNKNRNITNFLGLVTSKNQCDKNKTKIEQSFMFFLQKAEYMIINGNSLTIYNKNKDITLIFQEENKAPATFKK